MSKPNLASRTGPSLLLLPIENTLLVEWIKKSSQRGYPRKRSHIIEGAHIVMKRRNIKHCAQDKACFMVSSDETTWC